MKNSYLQSLTQMLSYYRSVAERAVAQVPDEALFWQYNDDSNSIAVIMRHMAGNMLSRFTDFLTTDGEKPWRNRDAEFDNIQTTRQELLDYWNQGWACLLHALETLTDEQLETVVYIRNDGHTVTEALNRQLAHYPYHVGQMVYIAKMVAGQQWQSLTIPRNQSATYNQDKFTQQKERRPFTDGQ